jgi:type IV secretory pathway component VirB8
MASQVQTLRPTADAKLEYTKYYHQDGALRAYANRAMVLAFSFMGIALISLIFAVLVRLQPPAVIGVDEQKGTAFVVNGRPGVRTAGIDFTSAPQASAPTELEQKNLVRKFLDNYLNYTPANVATQFSTALNLTTRNLRTSLLSQLTADDTINKINDENTISNFVIREIVPVRDQPLTYTAFGVNEVHHVHNAQETTDQIIGRFNVRLVMAERTETNPSGLLVAEYWEQQMVGDKITTLDQKDNLTHEATEKTK